jgi:hypothetical protein
LEEGIMALTDILMLAAGAGGIYYLFRPTKKAETAQDLFDYKDITPEGVIELSGDKFRLVLEVEPINMALRSMAEQATIWLGFKNMANTLTIPTTFLLQTRYLNLKDYLERLRANNQNSPELIKKLAEKHIEYLQRETEGKNLRDRRYFIILKIDAASAGVESGIQIENPILDTVVKSIPKNRPKTSSPELRKNAVDDLTEAASIVRTSLEAIGIHSATLNKKAVLELLYQTFNRDMAPVAMLEDVQSQNMMSLFMESRTPEMVLDSL